MFVERQRRPPKTGRWCSHAWRGDAGDVQGVQWQQRAPAIDCLSRARAGVHPWVFPAGRCSEADSSHCQWLSQALAPVSLSLSVSDSLKHRPGAHCPYLLQVLSRRQPSSPSPSATPRGISLPSLLSILTMTRILGQFQGVSPLSRPVAEPHLLAIPGNEHARFLTTRTLCHIPKSHNRHIPAHLQSHSSSLTTWYSLTSSHCAHLQLKMA